VHFKGSTTDTIDYIHRRTSDADIYFVRNKKIMLSRYLHVSCKRQATEWWNAETGKTVKIKRFSISKDGITIPLNLAAEQSAFIVFKDAIALPHQGKEAGDYKDIIYTTRGLVRTNPITSTSNPIITGPWEVRFEHRGNTPVADTMQQLVSWHTSKNAGVKYFSGQAAYHNSFDIAAGDLKKDAVLLLSLNKVKEIAEVYLNGKRLGLQWHPSQIFALTNELKPGKNHLVIEVVNSINNGLIGDAQKPKEHRQMRSNITRLPNAWQKPFAEAGLIEAGLIGPVTLQWASIVQ
jgi:hypothetical protein